MSVSRPGPTTARLEVVQPIRRVLRWMLSLRDGEGRIVCPDHRIEHTGKSAGAIVIAAELARLAEGEDRDALFDAAVQQGRRLVSRLEREGDTTCHTFRPGRHDPYNCSNNAIDGGAASDALAELVLTFGERLEPADREAFRRASVLCAQTYLRYATLEKGVPAQRAWAMTGVAGAWAIARHGVLELTVTEGAGVLEGIQNTDGSYPYHPLEWGAGHIGASDVSSFYHSRIPGFLMFSLERIGRSPSDPLFAGPIVRAVEFLLGLQGPDGIKCGLVEAKPWYFGASYEVASHPFDVWTLARAWRHFGRPRYAAAAVRAFRAWARHLGPDGEPKSHLPGPGREASYQCPLFFASHASWMARSMGDLEGILARAEPEEGLRKGIDLRVQHFPDASLTRVEDGAVVAWVRGARPGFNVHHGSPHGAGLVRVWSKASHIDVLDRPRFDAREAEWMGRAGRPSLARGWRSGADELRFSLWLSRNHWRAERRSAALAAPLTVLRRGVLRPAGSGVSSACYRTPETTLLSDGVMLESRLAWRDGTPVEDSALTRTFRVDGDGLAVEEKLRSGGGVRGLDYRIPLRATEIEAGVTEVRYRLA